jgi:hypothetical protein
MNCAIEVGTGAMIFVLNFIKIVSGIRKLTGVKLCMQIDRHKGDVTSQHLFFQNKGSEQKMNPIN